MSLEPLQSSVVDGTYAYSEKSIERGETLHLRVSSTNDYRLAIVRLGTEPGDTSADEEIFRFSQTFAAVPQPLYRGSYVNVDLGLPAFEAIPALTLECWVRLYPWANGVSPRFRGIISQHTYPTNCGFGLFVDDVDRLAFYAGTGGFFNSAYYFTGSALPKLASAGSDRAWHHVVGVFDPANGRVSLYVDNQEANFSIPNSRTVIPGTAPLRLGAYGSSGMTGLILDGDIAMPVIYNRALTRAEIAARFADQARTVPALTDVLGCWPLDEESGAMVHDFSEFRRHGTIINHGGWMIGGPSFQAPPPDQRANYDPVTDPNRGHGLRLNADDLFDCQWAVSHEFAIPDNARPGFYVARFEFGAGSIYDVTFIVRKRREERKAPILVVCNTNTWLAYNGDPFGVNDAGDGVEYDTIGRVGVSRRPGYCCYRTHELGQPPAYIGVNLPWPNARPFIYYGNVSYAYSHLLRVERYLHIWLEENGYEFDVATDFEVHSDTDLLRQYPLVIVTGHSEYWTGPSLRNVEQFLNGGGNLVLLSGNTFFWRVSFNADLTVMECRKYAPLETSISDYVPWEESWHSQDGAAGGVLRNVGYDVRRLVGLETCGYGNVGDLRPFRIVAPDFFLFHAPYDIDMADANNFATASVGHEYDVLYPDGDLYTDPSMKVLGEAPRDGGDYAWDHPVEFDAPTLPAVSNIFYWERPSGGRVFYVGSIGAAISLYRPDSPAASPYRLSLLLKNVLHHFLFRVSIEPGSGIVKISFWSEQDAKYQLQTTTNVAGTWTSVGTVIVGNGSITTVSFPQGAEPSRFYRAYRLPG